MGAEPLTIAAATVPESIDARDIDELLAFAGHLDRTAATWLDGLGHGARRHGRRVAYVLVGTAEYALGMQVLVRSLRAVTDAPILVLAAGGWKPALQGDRLAVLAVPEIIKPDLEPSAAKRFRRTLTKLWTFSFVSFDRLVYLDGDCLVRQPIDDLFDGAGFAAAPDLLCSQPGPVFNSGVFALSPDMALRRSLFTSLPTTPSFDGGDQGILNAFFGGDITWLPVRDNYLRTYEPIMNGAAGAARVIHYTAKKPWTAPSEAVGDHALLELDDVWTEQLDPVELMELIAAWRRAVAESEAASDATLLRIEAELLRQRRSGSRLLRRVLAALGLIALLQAGLLAAWFFG
jgi:glycogenin glucosyltransferase